MSSSFNNVSWSHECSHFLLLIYLHLHIHLSLLRKHVVLADITKSGVLNLGVCLWNILGRKTEVGRFKPKVTVNKCIMFLINVVLLKFLYTK